MGLSMMILLSDLYDKLVFRSDAASDQRAVMFRVMDKLSPFLLLLAIKIQLIGMSLWWMESTSEFSLTVMALIGLECLMYVTSTAWKYISRTTAWERVSSFFTRMFVMEAHFIAR